MRGEGGEPTVSRSASLGPLRVHPNNPRYFANASGQAVYLTGSHTWNNLQDRGPTESPAPFDYPTYLDWLVGLNHNFIRLWTWEQARWSATGDDGTWSPPRYQRTGPGLALDGKPKFDLTRFNPEYFARLRSRVSQANDRGMYVSIMLFNGWSGRKRWGPGDPFKGHPYHPQNNVNGLDGDPNGDHLIDLDAAAVRACDAAFVRQVIETVNDLPNVLYEVANEGGQYGWNRFVVDLIHADERGRPCQHPVGITAHGDETTASMEESAAEWISPGCLDVPSLYDDPPAPTRGKVNLIDSDHLWGVGGDHRWVWKCFCRGYNVIFMDPYLGSRWGGGSAPAPIFEPARRAMGHTLTLARRLDLGAMVPASQLSSRYYCLANPGKEYVVYLPEGGFVLLDLSDAAGWFAVEWIHPVAGTSVAGEPVEGGRPRMTFWSPYPEEAVLYLRRVGAL